MVILIFGGGAAHAQMVRGLIITPDSALVPGVIVTLFDSTNTAVARALGDDEGRYTLRAPRAGTFHIEARRLAFRPTYDVPLVLDTGKIRLHNIVLTGAPTELAGIHVSAAPRCEANPDSTTAAFAAWEEARKALRATQLTRMTRAYKVDVTTFVKHAQTMATREPVTDSALRTGLPIRPFLSRPPEQLAADGYLTRTPRSAVFHAPDEDVLLSESFAATHCLSILPDSGGPENLRLAFSPVPGRSQPEIAGVLTLDRASAELRRLDFSYVNLPQLDALGTPGGRIVFNRLPEGSWLISEWAIWLPFTEVRTDLPPPPAMGVTRTGQAVRVGSNVATRVGMETTGGHVTRVTFGDETVWMRPRSSPPPR